MKKKPVIEPILGVDEKKTPANVFQAPEVWNGNPVDMNYAPIPENKAESVAEIKTTLDKVTEETNKRFGLNEDGKQDEEAKEIESEEVEME